MKTLSRKTKITSLICICLWVAGSVLLYDKGNGKTTIILTAVVILVGIYAQIKKERSLKS